MSKSKLDVDTSQQKTERGRSEYSTPESCGQKIRKLLLAT